MVPDVFVTWVSSVDSDVESCDCGTIVDAQSNDHANRSFLVLSDLTCRSTVVDGAMWLPVQASSCDVDALTLLVKVCVANFDCLTDLCMCWVILVCLLVLV